MYNLYNPKRIVSDFIKTITVFAKIKKLNTRLDKGFSFTEVRTPVNFLEKTLNFKIFFYNTPINAFSAFYNTAVFAKARVIYYTNN